MDKKLLLAGSATLTAILQSPAAVAHVSQNTHVHPHAEWLPWEWVLPIAVLFALTALAAGFRRAVPNRVRSKRHDPR